jgi:transcriptional regulator with XRE-family HTH domain
VKQTRHLAGMRAFGMHLRTLRKQQGLSQEELNYRADLELSQISRIERGVINTSLSQILAIAAALKLPHTVLFEFELPRDDK